MLVVQALTANLGMLEVTQVPGPALVGSGGISTSAVHYSRFSRLKASVEKWYAKVSWMQAGQ